MAMTLRKKKESKGYFLGAFSRLRRQGAGINLPLLQHIRVHRIPQVQSHLIDAGSRIDLCGRSLPDLQHKQRHRAHAGVQFQSQPGVLLDAASGTHD
jgi:hypothetical protein